LRTTLLSELATPNELLARIALTRGTTARGLNNDYRNSSGTLRWSPPQMRRASGFSEKRDFLGDAMDRDAIKKRIEHYEQLLQRTRLNGRP
jgi:hypothetical protein